MMKRPVRTILLALFCCFLFSTAALGQSSVTDLIRQSAAAGKVSALEDSLKLLPTPLRSNFTFVHSGRGGLGADPKFPAVILFGDDAKALLAFNGHQSQVLYSALDILEFDDKLGRYIPSRFFFSPTAGELREAPDAKQIGRSNVYVELKPTSCLKCHGAHHHPIFESSYPSWPGFFGSDRDHLYGAALKSEVDQYTQFLKEVPNYPRYQALIFPDSKFSSTPPYLDAETENQLGTQEAYQYRPNLRFGAFLVRLNARTISTELAKKRNHKDLALLSFSLLRCDFSQLNQQKLAEARTELHATLRAMSLDPNKLKLNSTSFLNSEFEPNRKFAAQIIAAAGIPADFWNLSLATAATSEYGYWSGYGDTLDFVLTDLLRIIFGSEYFKYYRQAPINFATTPYAKGFQTKLNSLGLAAEPLNAAASCRQLANKAEVGR